MAETGTQIPPANETDLWSDLLQDLGEGGGDPRFAFLKPGTTHIRLLTPPKGPKFVKVNAFYEGKPRDRYMVLALILKHPTRENNDPTQVKALVMPKSVLQSIAQFGAESFDLFDHVKGHGLMLKKSGQGLTTDYAVVPSKQPIRVNEAVVGAQLATGNWDLEVLGAEFTAQQQAKSTGGGSPQKKGKPQQDAPEEDSNEGW